MKASVYTSPPDNGGVRSIRIELPEWPKVIMGVKAEDAQEDTFLVDLGWEWTFYAAGSFIGLDRGDRAEVGVVMAIENGPVFYNRSLHKEAGEGVWDAEDWKYANFAQGRTLRVWTVARCTGPNTALRPGQTWSCRPHIGLRLWTR